jgi:hypothetical protein
VKQAPNEVIIAIARNIILATAITPPSLIII